MESSRADKVLCVGLQFGDSFYEDVGLESSSFEKFIVKEINENGGIGNLPIEYRNASDFRASSTMTSIKDIKQVIEELNPDIIYNHNRSP